MTQRITTEIDALAAPKENGDVLSWPPNTEFASLAARNRRELSRCDFVLGNKTISQWRTATLPDAPVFMTGHQPAFFHAGVWIKSAAMMEIARSTEGYGRFLIVDSDLSRGAELAFPEEAESSLVIRSAAAFPHVAEQAWEQLPRLAPEPSRAFFDQLPATLRTGAVLKAFASGFAGADSVGFVGQWIAGMSSADRQLGHHSPEYQRISEWFALSCDSSAAAFAGRLIAEAESFAACYNGALAEYRARRGVRGISHPIPDLLVQSDRIETPFWVLRAAGPRQRLFVSRGRGDRLTLMAEKEAIFEENRDRFLSGEPGIPADAGVMIRPRALATTIYSRLLMCDFFIHGIGGAKYDQIADRIIHSYFKTQPPAYGCISATLRLPLPIRGTRPNDVEAAQRAVRDVRYNPQRFPEHVAAPEHLIRREAAIAESHRLRTLKPTDHAARRRIFERIRMANDQALIDPKALEAHSRNKLVAVRRSLLSDEVACSREWFFAYHDPADLVKLTEKALRESDRISVGRDS